MHVQRLQPCAEKPHFSASTQGFPKPLENFAIHRLDRMRALYVLGVVDIFDADDAHEIHILVVVIESEFHQPANRLTRLQGSEVHAGFGVADIAVELLQHLDVQLLLAAEVVIDHALGGVDALGDGVHAGAGQALLNKLDNGFLENILAGLFRIVLTTLARCVWHRGEIGTRGHGALTAIVVQAPIMGRGARRRKHPARGYKRAWRTAPLRDLAIAARRTATLAAP